MKAGMMKVQVLGLVCLVAAKFERRKLNPQLYYKVQERMWKVETDQRDYRLLQLSNNMEVLIGRSPRYRKSLVALDVNVGLRHDPPEIRGLAHLCEHMIYDSSFISVRRN
ncbi:hypothetical protein DSO57_1029967 [Entomophthora muscae]|uniref:Uncharacterized protein n=1 Tax=Entomophthora muscae TaxID=34485 RepID=A0ACC2TC55_9FUNG|nr:hypothetical protein DSO57_1029967 [Entomophthora muscae]